MKLQHTFVIPVARRDAWATLLDIGRVAQCFPGASLESVDGDEFTGSVKLKLGPITMTYAGRATFVEKDEAGYTLKVDASGRDKRGAGTARALVSAALTEDGAQGTTVALTTDLAITGKPAQFGRGVIEEVSSKILGQFAENLEASLSGPAAGDTAAEVGGGEAAARRGVHGAAPSGAATTVSATDEASLNMLSPAILVPLGKRLLPPLVGVAAGLLLIRAMTRSRRAEAPTIIFIDLGGDRP
ncbi:SRPBCC family protein [Nocardioides aquiterrae]|uniref:SRPBCC family protein n=1 Tax=Nocardioides aquiterrae TaxID=203799 RepID=A0ABP4EY43_9ACTN